MMALADRLRLHLDHIDPSRAHLRVGVQGVFAVGLAAFGIYLTPLWPKTALLGPFLAIILHVVLLVGGGGLARELRLIAVSAVWFGAAIAFGTLVPDTSPWFFPAVAALGLVSGLAVAFGPVGGVIGALGFVAFSLASTAGPSAGSEAERAGGLVIGLAATLAVLVPVHLVGRTLRLADLATPDDAPAIRSPLPLEKGVLIHALRLALTAVAAAGIAELLGIHHPLWVLLTVAIVLQRRLGETLMRGALRMTGTVVGAVLGWAIALAVGPDQTVWLAAALPILIVAIYFYVPVNYVAGIACVTMVVLFVYALLGQPLTASALERLTDTMLAALIGIVVSLVLIPESVVIGARGTIADFLVEAGRQYRRAMDSALGGPAGPYDTSDAGFLVLADAAVREADFARWEAIPGRRLFMLRRDIGRLVGELQSAIRDVGRARAGVAPGPSSEHAAAEAARVADLLSTFAETVREGRTPDAELHAALENLLASTARYPEVLGPERRAIAGLLDRFVGVQDRRFALPEKVRRGSS